MGLFKMGFGSVRNEQKRQEAIRESYGNKLFNFFLTENNSEADIIFLHDEPITFYGHAIQETSQTGKTRWNTYVCTGSDCPYCKRGEKSSFKGAFLVYDKTIVERDNNGTRIEAEAGIRLYLAGSRVLGQLDRINSKYGLTNYVWNRSRTGSRTSTVYAFDRGDEIHLDRTTIEDMLPPFLAEKFRPKNNTKEEITSEVLKLLTIQCEYLQPNNGGANSIDDEDYEDEEEVVASAPSAKPTTSSLGKRIFRKK